MWVKLDDQFWCNRKVRKARESVSAYVRLLSWCAAEESDGFIPSDEVEWICAGLDDVNRHIEVLIDVGLLAEHGDDLVIPDYLEFNYSKVELEEKRQKDRSRKRPGRPTEPSNPSARTPHGIRAESHTDSAAPGPSRPDPTRPGNENPSVEQSSTTATEIRTVFEHWQHQLDHPQAKLDDKRRKAIKARLADGYTVEDLTTAIDGILLDPHKMGNNDRGRKFDDIELACRTAANVDALIELARNGTPKATKGDRRERTAAALDEWTSRFEAVDQYSPPGQEAIGA